MKRLCITYHMGIDHSKPSDDYPHNIETAENCITIPMVEEVADDILEKQRDSQYVNRLGDTNLTDILKGIAKFQGYVDAIFVMAEEVRPFER